MSEGTTCYERDEALCEDQMCVRTGCRIRNERLARCSSGSVEALPCPFCGKQPYVAMKDRAAISCRGEECFGPRTTAEFLEDAVYQWNKRAPQSVSAAQGAWMPIETAPKDGPIMLCVTGFLPCVGRWWPLDGCWTSFDWEGHFESDKETSDHVNSSSYEPTHWKPLPAGPSVPSTKLGSKVSSTKSGGGA